MTTIFFERQIAGLQHEFDVIAYDPRGQGNSGKPSNINFDRRGIDLAEIISSLGLIEPVIVGWSLGVIDLYSYLKQFGESQISGIVFVDQGPKAIPENKNDWTFGTVADLYAFYAAFRDNPKDSLSAFLRQSILSKVDEKTLSHLLREANKTPHETARLLLADGWFRNYESVLRHLLKPILHIVSTASRDNANRYLNQLLRKPDVVAFGGHMMFWDESARFNKLIGDFTRNT